MTEEKTEVKAKKETKPNFELGEVATQTEFVVRNAVTDEILNVPQSLALILNKLDEISRRV